MTDQMTLEQLEKDVWPAPGFDSHLTRTVHGLRKKQLRDFGVEDLRIMLGQSVGAKYLLPKAIDVLAADPFASGDLYEGDLLVAIARHPENLGVLIGKDRRRLARICSAVINSAENTLRQDDLRTVRNLFNELEAELNR